MIIVDIPSLAVAFGVVYLIGYVVGWRVHRAKV